ncbi:MULTISPECIES: DsbA family oxidoreductase [Arthrobacter]|uniref:DsbA family oxidoreductase n=2 Tax=Arthrobacter TaxID=1663 RepID=A0ABU9KHU0_9MICC|nr:DsbA family oxidoreductase [Arthrobacter sp. YJM1]MDP5226515.1 DsbA family oxidoreductase [Arthrobacter sp. YJM1]
MKIEIWSDVACPWCYIGKRRFEKALESFPHKHAVEVQWRSYQLDPSLPEHYDGTELSYLSQRKGMAPDQVKGMFAHVAEQAAGEGLAYDFDTVVVANSFTAHRLIHLAAASGKADAAKERLLSDHFEHGKDIGSAEYLRALGLELGLNADDVEELFTTDKYTDAVQHDIAEARALGVSGVPFFVFDRKYGVSGAQASETFTQVLNEVWQESHPLLTPVAVGTGGADAGLNGEACGPDGC